MYSEQKKRPLLTSYTGAYFPLLRAGVRDTTDALRREVGNLDIRFSLNKSKMQAFSYHPNENGFYWAPTVWLNISQCLQRSFSEFFKMVCLPKCSHFKSYRRIKRVLKIGDRKRIVKLLKFGWGHIAWYTNLNTVCNAKIKLELFNTK